MTTTSVDLDAALAGAAAIIPFLPAADLSPVAPQEGASALGAAIPGAGSKAVVAALRGEVNGSLVIVLNPELAIQMENGPLGPQELAVGLEPALTDLVSALTPSLGAIRAEAAQSLDAEVALANAAGYDDIIVVMIAGATGASASVVILLEAASAPVASFNTFGEDFSSPGASRNVELLSDVAMGVTAELGRTRMTVRELLTLQPGSIVELDRAAGSPVDLLVNGTLVARGEVVVIDEEFGVRITEIIGYDTTKSQK